MEDPSDSVQAIFCWLTHIQRIDQIGQWEARNGLLWTLWKSSTIYVVQTETNLTTSRRPTAMGAAVE